MSNFAKRIRPYVKVELALAKKAEQEGSFSQAFHFLERAHVLGQCSTSEHVRVHTRMLLLAFKHRRLGEIVGQLLRISGAATKTPFGIVPTGNTGGSNVNPFQRMAIYPDLRTKIESAKRK